MEVAAPFAITSTPALAAALRVAACDAPHQPSAALFRRERLVPMYRIKRLAPAAEAAAAAHVLAETAERLRRLGPAYAEWREFDACAYFDLLPAQAHRLVRISERVATVHVTFYADLLLPSFRSAERYWAETFCPAYRRMTHSLAQSAEPLPAVLKFQDVVQPRMVKRWLALQEILEQTRRLLDEDASFLAANGSEDERARWRQIWRQRPAAGLDPRLQPALPSLPTLTLSVDFPLPPYRQPGRLRRLRTNRTRRQPPLAHIEAAQSGAQQLYHRS